MIRAPHALGGMALAWVCGSLACAQVIGLGEEKTYGGGEAGGMGGEGPVLLGGSPQGGQGGEGGSFQPCAFGDVAWVRSFGDAENERVDSLTSDGEGGVYLGGVFAGQLDLGDGPLTSAGLRDVVIARFNGEGEVLWGKAFGDISDDFPSPNVVGHPQGVIIAGGNQSVMDFGDGLHSSDGADAYIAMLDKNGGHRWTKWLAGPDEQGCTGAAVDPTTGDIIVAVHFKNTLLHEGQTFVSAGDNDLLVLRLDSTNGAMLDAVQFEGPLFEFPRGIAVDAAGRVVLGGNTTGEIDLGQGVLPGTDPDGDAFIVTLNPDFTTLWAKRYVAEQGQWTRALAIGPNGQLWASGRINGTFDVGTGTLDAGPSGGAWLARFDMQTGSVLAAKVIPGFDSMYNLAVADSGRAVAVGAYSGTVQLGDKSESSVGDRDPLLVRFDASLTVIDYVAPHPSVVTDLFGGVAINPDGSAFTSGHFWESFALTGCPTLPSAGTADILLLKRRP